MLLDSIFQFRTLLGKCELGIGLEWDEIGHMTEIEQVFASRVGDGRRRYSRYGVLMSAVVRGECINDAIEIVELGPGGLVCRKAPFIARGEEVEIVIDEGEYSYRFKARGVWLRDDGEDYQVGLQLIGMPVRLHTVALSKHEPDVVDKVLLARAA